MTTPAPLARTAIEFRVHGYTPADDTRGRFAQLIQHAVTGLGLPVDAVKTIVVADNGSYGAAIREFAPGAGYTNDGVYRGVGKNIPQFVDGIYAGCVLVLHVNLVDYLLNGRGPSAPAGAWESLGYGFFHELGHAVDHVKRPAQHFAPSISRTISDLQYCAAHNARALVEEYAACFFSAAYLPAVGYEFLAQSTYQNIETYLSTLVQQRQRHERGLLPLSAVRDAALNAFWRGLFEFGKLYAFQHANPAAGAAPKWPARSPDTAQTLMEFAAGLRSAWTQYPHCEAEFERVTTRAWLELTAAEGYRFAITPAGDTFDLS